MHSGLISFLIDPFISEIFELATTTKYNEQISFAVLDCLKHCFYAKGAEAELLTSSLLRKYKGDSKI